MWMGCIFIIIGHKMHPFPLLIEICVTGATEKISGPRFNLFAGALSQAKKGKVSANQR